MTGHLVGVVWRDAHADAKAEMGPEEIALARSFLFTSYGILVRDDREKVGVVDPVIAVAHEKSEGSTYRGVTFIPLEMVKEVVDFGLPKVKKVRRISKKASAADTPPSEREQSAQP